MRRAPPFPLSRRGLLAAVPVLALGRAALAQNAAPPAAAATPPAALPVLSPAQRSVALAAVNAAESHGLARRQLSADVSNEDLGAALLQYAQEVHAGRLKSADFQKDWGVRPPPYDPRPEFIAAATTDKLADWLDRLPPPYAGYAALKRGLANYRAIAAKGGWRSVPAGPAFGLGDASPRTAALRTRLAAEDPAVSARKTGPFDEELQQAVVRAQRRFGLKPDGIVTAETLTALNQPVGQRVLQIIANLERWRWLPPTMPATRLQVNSGAAIVTLFRDDRPVLSMKAVSGRVGDETPMLFSNIHSVVLNPPWNVPTSIATKELWPKEKKSPGYLARNGYTVIKTDDGGVRLQQKAGAKSALGRFKFDFPNPYGVYLHDTPTQSTFSRYGRQASHGCVRLERPRDLAQALLTGSAEWPAEAIDAALEKGDTVRARLPQSVPVFIFYWTAFAAADGTMNFRSDPYNWDSLLLQRIGVLGGTQA